MKFKIFLIIFLPLLIVGIFTLRAMPDVPNISEPISTIGKITNQQEGLIVIQLKPEEYAAQIEYDQAGKYISQWRGNDEEIIINGGYFNEDYSPSGFLVVNGKRIGTRSFDQDRSGLFVVKNGQLSIRDLKEQPIGTDEQFEFALQSYPFLIKDGRPAIAEDSGKKASRTALGIDAKGNVYIIISLSEVSLYEAMNKIDKLEIDFTSVLNLDGGPSTGIYKNWNGENLWHEGFSKVPNIFRFKMISKFQAP